jgi:hypothetical protein
MQYAISFLLLTPPPPNTQKKKKRKKKKKKDAISEAFSYDHPGTIWSA